VIQSHATLAAEMTLWAAQNVAVAANTDLQIDSWVKVEQLT